MIFIFMLLFVIGVKARDGHNAFNEQDKVFVKDVFEEAFASSNNLEKTISKLEERNSILIAENVLLKDKVKKSAFMPKTFGGWVTVSLGVVCFILVARVYYTLYMT